jgi:hypothetical protein
MFSVYFEPHKEHLKMEVIGLVTSIASLAQLFTTCMDVLDKVDTYRNFGSDSRYLVDQFDADKLLLKQWATNIGLESKVPDPRKEEIGRASLFDDEEILSCMKRILADIMGIFEEMEAGIDKLHLSGRFGYEQSSPPGMRKKIGWALTGKLKFVHQIQQFEALLSRLYSLNLKSAGLDGNQSSSRYITPGSSNRGRESVRQLMNSIAKLNPEWFEQSQKTLEHTKKLLKGTHSQKLLRESLC